MISGQCKRNLHIDDETTAGQCYLIIELIHFNMYQFKIKVHLIYVFVA